MTDPATLITAAKLLPELERVDRETGQAHASLLSDPPFLAQEARARLLGGFPDTESTLAAYKLLFDDDQWAQLEEPHCHYQLLTYRSGLVTTPLTQVEYADSKCNHQGLC